MRVSGPVLSLLWAHSLVLAQGTLVTLNTGGGQVLVSETRTVMIDGAWAQPRLLFDFGYATDETALPGIFLDSFTVTLQDSNQVFTAIYLTADASGVAWVPSTPGTVAMDPASINASALSYPSLEPVLAGQLAFQVDAAIPAQFIGHLVNIHFDLYDNLDAQASQAWFSDLRVMNVPEPAVWCIWLLAVVCGWTLKRLKR